MPLIECPDCRASVSNLAAACPACGFPIRRDPAQQLGQGHLQSKAGAQIDPSRGGGVLKFFGWAVLGCAILLIAFVSIGASIRASRSPEQNHDLDVVRTCRKIVASGQAPQGACSQMESEYTANWGEAP